MTIPDSGSSVRARRGAFTIIESLVVIAIIGILSVLILALVRYHTSPRFPAGTLPPVESKTSIPATRPG